MLQKKNNSKGKKCIRTRRRMQQTNFAYYANVYVLYLAVFGFTPLDSTTIDHTIYVTAIVRLCRCGCNAQMVIIARIVQIMALVHISVVNR